MNPNFSEGDWEDTGECDHIVTFYTPYPPVGFDPNNPCTRWVKTPLGTDGGINPIQETK